MRQEPRYRISFKGGGLGIEIDEVVLLSAVATRDGHKFWVAERRLHESNWCGDRRGTSCARTETRKHDWIDERSCPALDSAVAQLPRVWLSDPASKPDYRLAIVTDTPLLTIEPSNDKHGLRSTLVEYLGPSATWWRESEERLAACWRVQPPTVNRRPVHGELGSD